MSRIGNIFRSLVRPSTNMVNRLGISGRTHAAAHSAGVAAGVKAAARSDQDLRVHGASLVEGPNTARSLTEGQTLSDTMLSGEMETVADPDQMDTGTRSPLTIARTEEVVKWESIGGGWALGIVPRPIHDPMTTVSDVDQVDNAGMVMGPNTKAALPAMPSAKVEWRNVASWFRLGSIVNSVVGSFITGLIETPKLFFEPVVQLIGFIRNSFRNIGK